MRAVAYARVSTDEQSESGLGLEAQAHACSTWAAREGRGLIGPFADEGVSGAAGLDRRPALLDALTELRPGDVLLVAKRDRLGRDPIAVAMIEAAVSRQGCRVVSAAGEGTASDDPTDVLMRRIVDAFAEYERLVIKARTKAALSAKRRRGERSGQVPFGMAVADDGRRSKKGNLPVALAADRAEQDLIPELPGWRSSGWSLRRIAAELDRRGVPPKNGRPSWHHSSVAAILTRTASEAP